MLPLPLFHVYGNVGVQPLAFVGPNPLSLVPESARHRRSAEDDQAGEAGVLQRRADALHRHPESSRRARRQGGPELDQAVLLRRGGADGRNEAAVRGEDRRAHRRRLLADRRHDGVLRQPGAGHATRSARSACRCPTSRCASSMPRTASGELPAGRGRRDDPARAAAHGGVLEQPARDGGDAARARRRRTPGCTPATSPTWTRTATSSSSIARRT